MNAIEAAKKQSLFRDVNDGVRNLNESVKHETRYADFVCECAKDDCIEPVRMSVDAYEEVRKVPTHFAVAAGMNHVFPDVERIFARRGGYFVVEMFGEAGVEAIKLDPRSHTGRVEEVELGS